MKLVAAAQRVAVAGSFLAVLILSVPSDSAVPSGYRGFPYLDSIQEIPGKIRLFRFDQGMAGKTQTEAALDANTNGVTWHDYNSHNNWYCHARDATGVGLQNMGAGGDHMEAGSPGGNLTANTDCYLAETNQGDWTKYTVKVAQPGIYSINFFEAAAETQIPYVSVAFLNGADSVSTGTDTMHVTSYYHSWWYMVDYRRIALDSGVQVLRFDIVGNGPMNVDYLDFSYIGPVSVADRGIFASQNGGLSLKSITPQADRSLQLNFTAADATPATVQCFDARGSLLFSETINGVAMGYNHIPLKGKVPGKGMLFVRMTQGNKTAQGKVFMFGR
jgi:hypothetical protein